MSQKSNTPRNLPSPIIFGPAFPNLRLIMKHGTQSVESRTNRNLFLGSYDFTDDGTYTMGRFLQQLGACKEAHTAADGWCPMLFGAEERYDDYFGNHTEHVLLAKPQIGACPGVGGLLELCQTESQRRFLKFWCESQATYASEGWDEEAETPSQHTRAGMQARLGFPALIPEVWLNYLGPDKSADDEIHLEENPSRVDFVLFGRGRKAVVEIDGPSHYADFNESTRRYVVSEQRYTKNLRIERSLKDHGWEVHRFSDYEIKAVPEDRFWKLVRHLPGADDIPF